MRLQTPASLAPLLLLLTALAWGPVVAAPPINTLEKSGLLGRFKPSGVAIRGYDPVAYFTAGRALAGTAEHTFEWRGATWHFASEEHRARFAANPAAYAPQYGGYCAYGVAEGYLVKIEPDNWSIVDGNLYLNYDDDVQRRWERDVAGYIAKADAGFEDLLESE